MESTNIQIIRNSLLTLMLWCICVLPVQGQIELNMNNPRLGPNGFRGISCSDEGVCFAPAGFMNAIAYTTDWGETWSLREDMISQYHTGFNASFFWVNPSHVFYMGIDGLLRRSSDAGVTFDSLHQFHTIPYQTIDWHFFNLDTGLIFISHKDSLFLTTDAGATWSHIDNLPEHAFTLRADLKIDSDGAILMRYDEYLFKSDDLGAGWSEVSDGVPYVLGDFTIVDDTSYYGSRNVSGEWDPDLQVFLDHSLLYTSKDQGLTWSVDTIITHQYDQYGFFGSIEWINSKVGYLSSSKIDEGIPVYKTDDGGKTWDQLSFSPSSHLTREGPIIEATSEDSIWMLFPDGVFARTSDAGSNWDLRYWACTLDDINVARKLSSGIYLFGGNHGAVVRVEDDQMEMVNFPSSSTIEDILVTANDTVIAITESGEVFLSSDDGIQWTLVDEFDIEVIACDHHNSTLVVAGRYGEVFISTDHGKTWMEDSPTLSNLDFRLFLTGAIVHSSGKVNVTGWTEGQGEFPPMYEFSAVWSPGSNWDIHEVFSSSPNGRGRLIELPSGTILGKSSWNVWRSTDTGATWQIVNTQSRVIDWKILNGQIIGLKAAGTGTLYTTGDEGESWTQIDTFQNADYYMFHANGMFLSQTDTVIFGDNGLIASNHTWQDCGVTVISLDGGIYGPLGLDSSEESPLDLIVYPNPSDGVIQFTSDDELLEVRVLDMNGSLIHTSSLRDKRLNLKHLTGGIYLLSIRGTNGMYYSKILLY